MKKLVFSIAFMAVCAFGMNAQLTVLKSGNVRIGQLSNPLNLSSKIVAGTGTCMPDTLASLNIMGSGTNNRCGGYITFGDLKKVGIGELPVSTATDTDILLLFGSKGLYYKADNKLVFAYSNQSVSTPFTFNCDVRGNSFIVNSDSRLKSNISSLDGFSSSLGEISPAMTATTEARSPISAESEKLASAYMGIQEIP